MGELLTGVNGIIMNLLDFDMLTTNQVEKQMRGFFVKEKGFGL